MMSSSEIQQLLKIYKEKTASRYGISRLGIFGSYAKGESTEKSDIDIIVELQTPDIFKMIHIKEELQELLGKRVDIIRNRDKMNPYLKKHIEKEAIYV
ncbi:nucleotidyltransferase domain protein [bacterium BMS3Abin08]|nr:nucleotidyltransferase domain protein [bacterium BMS3Abin08]HDL21228.1 hypothetical protein [Nitrospirota bacterium]